MSRVRFVFDVVPDGGEPFRVVAGPRDVSRWERTGKGRSLGSIERDPSMQALEQIAYTAAHRQGLFSGPLNEFQDTCDVHPQGEDEEDADADEAGPTPAVP